MNLARGPADYTALLVDPAGPTPVWATDAQAEVHRLLMSCAIAFAEGCNGRPDPKFPRDGARRSTLLYGRGLGADESATFLRALESGLATVASDGAFFVPTARACSSNLHLVGRNEDHVAVHTEVLIHVGAYSELVLDHGWEPERLVFDPFIRGAALDLWGFNAPPGGDQNWWEGTIVLVAEAKARLAGSDSLGGLAGALERLQDDPTAVAHSGHRRKWDELATIAHEHGSVELLLVADGARWWYDVTPSTGPRRSVHLTRRP